MVSRKANDFKSFPTLSESLARAIGPRSAVLDGEDLRYVPLIERKAKLRALVSNRSDHLLYCDHIEAHGDKLFAMACKKDLEGIVAKRKFDPYIVGEAQWMKIRNTVLTVGRAGKTIRAGAGSRS